MVNCSKCLLKLSVRVVNLVVILCGIGTIIYSLWLLKRWKDGFSHLGFVSSSPKPWFIYTCLSMAIVVCLSMITGHSVIDCISFPTLAIYLASLVSVLGIEVGMIVFTFFKINWESKISEYIAKKDDEFESFLYLHLAVCRFTSVIILIAQVNAVVLMVILWAVGPAPRNHCSPVEQPEFRQSFLVRSESLVHLNGTEQH